MWLLALLACSVEEDPFDERLLLGDVWSGRLEPTAETFRLYPWPGEDEMGALLAGRSGWVQAIEHTADGASFELGVAWDPMPICERRTDDASRWSFFCGDIYRFDGVWEGQALVGEYTVRTWLEDDPPGGKFVLVPGTRYPMELYFDL